MDPMVELMQELRAHPRYHAGVCGMLRPLEREVSIGEQVVYITDCSDGGLAVCIDHEVPVGALLQVEAAGCSFVGTIVYCRQDGDGYAAGIKLHGCMEQVRMLRRARRPPLLQAAAE